MSEPLCIISSYQLIPVWQSTNLTCFIQIVVALGPKYEISSSVGSVILYSHEFPLSINFKRATHRRELVCYGVITLRCLASSGNVAAHCHLLPSDA